MSFYLAVDKLERANGGDSALAVFLCKNWMWLRSRISSGDAAGAAEAARGVDDGGAGDSHRLNAAIGLDLDPDRRRRVLRKLYLRTVPIACLITCATFIDRANLALAAPVLLHDIGLSRSQFGFASAVMFVSYGLCMCASALMFTVVSLRIWFCVIVSAWGAVTALMAVIGVAGMKASTSFAVLVVLRLALGAAEAGTMPGCFFLLSRFLPKRELAYAYSWVSDILRSHGCGGRDGGREGERERVRGGERERKK